MRVLARSGSQARLLAALGYAGHVAVGIGQRYLPLAGSFESASIAPGAIATFVVAMMPPMNSPHGMQPFFKTKMDKMLAAAHAEGHNLSVFSGYRQLVAGQFPTK